MKINIVRRIFLLFILTMAVNSNAIFGQTKPETKPEYYKVSEVRIFINDISDVQSLREQGIARDKIKLSDNYFDVVMDSVQIDILKKSGYPYEILIDDVTKDYLERTKESREKIKLKKRCKSSGFGFGSMGGFYTFDEVIAQLDTIHLLYPNLITEKDSIGASVEGRTIWAIKISDNPDIDEEEDEIFYNSLTHAREPEGMMVLLYFMFYLLENYGQDPEVTYLVNNRELYFVPVINPDGYLYNEIISSDGGGMWRKNRRDNGNGTFGVDLNRNYGYMWGYDNFGSSPITDYEDYRGSGPFSEPETQAIRQICIDHNFITSCNYHTYWNVIFPPWGYNMKETQDSTTYNNFIAISNSLNGYRNGIFILPPENYPTNGDVNDWMYGETIEKNKIYAVLTEVGNDNDGFWPVPERIVPLAEENLYSNLIYAWGPGIIEGTSYISDFKIDKRYLIPLTDTLRINAIECNPQKQNTLAYAEILGEKDTIIDQIQLDKNDSCFSGIWYCNLQEENFYKVRFNQKGTDIPSNFYYNPLKFTTAGPVIVDSVETNILDNFRYLIKPFVMNESANYTLNNLRIFIFCSDPWVTKIVGSYRTISTISPGDIISNIQPFAITYDSASFPGYFNLKFEISKDGCTYWTDSVRVVTPTVGIDDKVVQPLTFKLDQNYPNPFNPTTSIQYAVSNRQFVSLKVYDVIGNKIETLFSEEKPAGTYELTWNAEGLSSGVYFYQLKAVDPSTGSGQGFISTKKMLLLK